MDRYPEDAWLERLAARLPDSGYEGRTQFATILPFAALFNGIISLGFVGFGALPALVPAALTGSGFAWLILILELGPPILWIGSFFYLKKRRRLGWRMFAVAAMLATIGALWTLQIFSLAFDLLFLYAAIQARDAYRY